MSNWNFYAFLEVRAFYEALALECLKSSIARKARTGDGHTVIVIPGFGFSGSATQPLRDILTSVGYNAVDWGAGTNMGPSPEIEHHLEELLYRNFCDSGHKVSIVGWSLGGLYARWMANSHPEFVRRIITLGSPYKINPNKNFIKEFFDIFTANKVEVSDRDLEKIRQTPVVPCVSIWTKTDGVVDWNDCVLEPGPLAENVEVRGSHAGLCFNTRAIETILRKL